MKITPWTIVKILVILVFTVSIALHRLESSLDAQALGVSLAISFGLLAIFQLIVWLFYDVVTLKRGGWIIPSFGESPFSQRSGPGFYLGVISVALLIFGLVKLACALVHGFPSLVLGLWLIGIGSGLLLWQRMLRALFRSRLARRPGEPDAAGNSRPTAPSSGL